MAQEKVKERIVNKVTEWEPELYDVIMHNDDVTTMDFVIEVLRNVFFHEFVDAYLLMLTIHNDGEAVVGCYEYDIATSKMRRVREQAASEGFPLRVSLHKK